jgi:hypothetical protein
VEKTRLSIGIRDALGRVSESIPAGIVIDCRPAVTVFSGLLFLTASDNPYYIEASFEAGVSPRRNDRMATSTAEDWCTQPTARAARDFRQEVTARILNVLEKGWGCGSFTFHIFLAINS